MVCGAAATALTANWGAGDAAPSGCDLSLEVTSLTAGCGSAVVGGITVSGTAQNIVSSIGSCATGTGGSDGAQLSYTLSVTDDTQLDCCDDQTVTITLLESHPRNGRGGKLYRRLLGKISGRGRK